MGKVHQWQWSSGGRFTRRTSSGDNKESSSSSSTSSSAGCMSGVLNLFDFHQFQFPMSNQPCFKPNSSATLLQQEDLKPCTVISKGVQAPRNSLESEEGSELFAKLSPQASSRNMKDHHEHLLDDHVPAEAIQVVSTKPAKMGTAEGDHRTMARIRVVDELSSSDQSSCIGSPGLPKTPTLVARLMGLDLLPENGSPSPKLPNSAQSYHQRNAVQSRQPSRQIHKTNNKSKFEDASITGTRSLPETPRISSARKSDVDGSRFSLQINKENAMEEFDCLSRASSTRDHQQRRREHYYFNYSRHDEEMMNRSPSQYARQLAKQVKESVSRRVAGLDITNATREHNADRTEASAPKSKKQKRPTKNSGGGHDDQLTNSSKHYSTNSPRIRSAEQKNIKSQTSDQQQSVTHASDATIGTKSTHQQRRSVDKCKKASCERFTQRREAVMTNRASSAGKANLKIQEQKKSKKNTPLSIKDLVGGPAAVNKEHQSIPSTTPIISSQTHQLPCSSSKPSESSTQLSSSSSPNSYQPHQQQSQRLLQFDSRDDKINNRTSEFHYVTEILKRTGLIERDSSSSSSSSSSSIVSPSHPLDPSIFDCLEQHNWSSQRHNRRLVFDLVDEILSEILRPYLIAKPWLRCLEQRNERIRSGEELVQQIWSKIGRFPNANCQILQDIDDLIEQDLPNSSSSPSTIIYEEYEPVVIEIERDLLDSLLLEISRR
ncbi:hypothetical protein Scep_006425 [Stephania cephalantha]|uniref:DUF4378 domain-containing protein n=1 Tax=Stephania cephalantha TaxID=152367 RepID=A0AAP0PK22_9MAGN